ncbi:hypothetical protein T06_2728, partial [Trichinella sp. T6]
LVAGLDLSWNLNKHSMLGNLSIFILSEWLAQKLYG